MSGWKLYYLATSRIPGEKAHSIQIIKMLDALLSEKCDVELLLAKRKNEFKIKTSLNDYYYLKNLIPIKRLFSVSIFHLFTNPKIQWLFFNLMTLTFTRSALNYINKNRIKKTKIIFSREEGIIKKLIESNIDYPMILELHQLPSNERIKNISIYKKCTIIFTISNYLKDRLIELGIDTKKIFVLQSGYDENLFSKSTPINLLEKFNLPSNAKIVLYAGSFEAWKLSNFLVNSARYTSNNVFFVMVGKPSAQILELVKNQNLQNKIKFVGYVSYHEIPQYLLSADVLIQYSPSSPKSGELGSFSPVKLFEYMAVGKSVLAPNLPWIKEIIVDRKNGLLFDPSSPKDLSNKIELLINDSELQKKICYQSEMDVIKYSFTERAKNMIKIINDMI